MKLWTENMAGNLHVAAATINDPKFWVIFEEIVTMSFSGSMTIVVFKVTDAEYNRLKEKYYSKPYPLPKELPI